MNVFNFKRILTLNFVILSFSNIVFSQGINFNEGLNLEQLKALARKSNKPIFIDCMTSWCGPCAKMAKYTFTNDTVANYYNKTFTCAKMDMEKGFGVDLRTNFNIIAFPTLLFLDTAGVEVQRSIGGLGNKDFIKLGEKYFDPTQHLSTLREEYKNGNREKAFIHRYIAELNNIGTDVTELADWYFASMDDDYFVTSEIFAFIDGLVTDFKKPACKRFLENEQKFRDLVGDEKVDSKIKRLYYKEFEDCFSWKADKDGKFTQQLIEPAFNALLEKHKDTKLEMIKEMKLRYSVLADALKKDWVKWQTDCKIYVPKYLWDNWAELNSIAWSVFENGANKESLKLAQSYAKRSIELEKDYANMDTYANICFALNQKKEAKIYAEKSIELAKTKGIDASPTVNLLESINAVK